MRSSNAQPHRRRTPRRCVSATLEVAPTPFLFSLPFSPLILFEALLCPSTDLNTCAQVCTLYSLGLRQTSYKASAENTAPRSNSAATPLAEETFQYEPSSPSRLLTPAQVFPAPVSAVSGSPRKGSSNRQQVDNEPEVLLA